MLPWHQYILGFLFVAAGFYHFHKPGIYLRIMPPYFPAPSTLVLLSGALEMILGLMLLNPPTQVLAAWGLIGLMILFIPVHLYMLREKDASLGLPLWLLILRIPLQFGLIYWIYQYS